VSVTGNQRSVRSGSTTDQLRRDNLSRVLRLLHRDGAASRSELTKAVGLSRSTMASVVADLEHLGLARESAPEPTPRAGRPSGIVHPADDVVAVTVNPEVDAVHVGLVGFGGRVIKHARVQTPSNDVNVVVALAAATIRGMLSDDPPRHRVLGMGLAIPGQIRMEDGVVRQATHLGWSDAPVADLLSRATGLRAWAANAATLALRAESAFGAGRDVRDLVYLIGGASGIGGGVVMDDRLLVGAEGYAGEFGHTVVTPGGSECHCGGVGCLEAEVDQQTLMTAAGLLPEEAHLLAEALPKAVAADPATQRLVDEKSRLLAITVRNAVNIFNPRVVLLSGFLAALHAASSTDLTSAAIASSRSGVELRTAALGSEQLMIGAAELVFDELLNDPTSFSA